MKRYVSPTGELYTLGTPIKSYTDNGLSITIPNEEDLLAMGYTEYIEPTPDPKEIRKQEILAELASMDYLTCKYIDGEDMSEYGDWQAKRRALREEYRRLISE